MIFKYSKLLAFSALGLLGLSSVKGDNKNSKYPLPIYLKDEPVLDKTKLSYGERVAIKRAAAGIAAFEAEHGKNGVVELSQKLLDSDFHLKSMPKKLRDKVVNNLSTENTFFQRYYTSFFKPAYGIRLYRTKTYSVGVSAYKDTFS